MRQRQAFITLLFKSTLSMYQGKKKKLLYFHIPIFTYLQYDVPYISFLFRSDLFFYFFSISIQPFNPFSPLIATLPKVSFGCLKSLEAWKQVMNQNK